MNTRKSNRLGNSPVVRVGVTPRRTRFGRTARAEDGIALLVVLWFVALLTLLATGAAALSLLHRQAAQAFGDEGRAKIAADSAIQIVLLQLAARGQFWETWLDGASRKVQITGASVAVRVELEDGRIDLNTGSRKLLYALFAANGWSDSDAMTLVARIEDWKAPDGHPHPAGAELRDYQAMGRSYGPRNAPFECVAELRQVLGAEKVSRKLMDALTVYTHAKYPLQSAAPTAVQRALKWADQRRLGDRRWLVKTTNSAGAVDNLVATSSIGRLVRVHACATYAHATRCRLAVVRVTGNNRNPFEIFLWQSESDAK